jgi:hypothetical protein
MRRRLGQLAVVTVALPVAGWALERAAQQAEAKNPGSTSSRRLRQGADFMQGAGRGPLASRLRNARRD